MKAKSIGALMMEFLSDGILKILFVSSLLCVILQYSLGGKTEKYDLGWIQFGSIMFTLIILSFVSSIGASRCEERI